MQQVPPAVASVDLVALRGVPRGVEGPRLRKREGAVTFVHGRRIGVQQTSSVGGHLEEVAEPGLARAAGSEDGGPVLLPRWTGIGPATGAQGAILGIAQIGDVPGTSRVLGGGGEESLSGMEVYVHAEQAVVVTDAGGEDAFVVALHLLRGEIRTEGRQVRQGVADDAPVHQIPRMQNRHAWSTFKG